LIYLQEGTNGAQVVRPGASSAEERHDDEWWAIVNSKSTVPDTGLSIPKDEDSAFVVESLPSDPVQETRDDGTYSSYVPLPADGTVDEASPVSEEYDRSEEPVVEEQDEQAEEATETPAAEAIVDSPSEVNNAEQEVQQAAVTPETFTATVPGLRQMLVDQGIDPEFAEEMAEEAEKNPGLFSVPKIEQDEEGKYPWKYTTIQRESKQDEEADGESHAESNEPAAESDEAPEEAADDEVADELIVEPAPRDAPVENSASPEDEGDSPNDIKILGVSTATEVSQESVICFRGKCVQQDGRK
jgi:hypothetical protein